VQLELDDDRHGHGHGLTVEPTRLETPLVGRRQGRRVEPDSNPEAGYFFRSDQLHLAQLGIPVLYTSNGIDMVEGGVERGRALNEAYVANNYHKPSDEVTPDWDMSGGIEDLQLLYAVGRQLADNNSWPQWRANAEFRAARQQSGR